MSIAIKRGGKFSFPDDDKVYEFDSMLFQKGLPVIYYWDDDVFESRTGFYLSDLILK